MSASYFVTNGISRTLKYKFIPELEIHSVERGICAIATSTMNELFLYWPDAWRMHETAVFPLPV